MAFYDVREAIEACPTLFFLNDTDEIYLLTDASDYGIGAYLFQTVEGVEKSIRFMSHSLSEVEGRWSTIEKECYAIFRAFQDMEYLIRDRRFHLLTDHRNLVFMSNPSGTKGTSEKVLRWRLAIQAYDFDVDHIKGKDNKVADDVSRLVGRAASSSSSSSAKEIPEKVLFPSIGEILVAAISDAAITTTTDDTKTGLIGQFHNEVAGHFGVE